MGGRLAVRIGLWAMGAGLLVGSTARAQEHVRLVPQLGVTGAITAIAFSPVGRKVLTADGEMPRLWDTASGKQIRSFPGHKGWVSSVAFSSDGRFLLTGGNDSTAKLWDAASGQQIRSFEGHTGGINSVAYSPDGRLVLTGGDDNTARLWDAAGGRQIRLFEGSAKVINAVAFSGDGRLVVTGGDDNTAQMWNAATGRKVRSFGVRANAVNSAVPSADNRSGQSRSGDKTVQSSDEFGECDFSCRLIEVVTKGVTSVAFSPDDRFVITRSKDDETARVWDAASGQQVRSFEGDAKVIGITAFSPDGRFVVTFSTGTVTGPWTEVGTARLWDAASGKQIRSFDGDTRAVTSVALSPDGRSMLTVDYDDKVQLWDLSSGQRVRSFDGHTQRVTSVAFSPDGHLVLTAGFLRGTARLWNAASGQQIRSFPGHGAGEEIESVAFSPDGKSVLTGGSPDTAQLWDIDSGRQIRSFEGNGSGLSVAFSPDGRFVLAGSSDNTARLWDASTGEQIRSFSGHKSWVNSVAFSPDGQFVVTGSDDHTVRLWDPASGRQVLSFPLSGHERWVHSVVFSPDGRFVLAADDDTIRLWDTANGRQIRSFEGIAPDVKCLAFSRDGRFVLAGSGDGAARLWDVTTGRQIQIFAGHTYAVSSVAFSPDGRFALTGSDDTTTRLWEVATGKPLVTLLSFDDGGWAATDQYGRYDSNDPNNTPGLIWATDSNRVIELNQLKDNYYTPNLLASIVKGERLPEVKGLDLVPAPPEVAIAALYQPESKRMSLSIANQGGGNGRLVVTVNGRQVAVVEHPVAERVAGKSPVSVDLSAATLRPGENTLQVYEFDAGNQIRSHEAVAKFTVAAKPKGVSADYDDSMASNYKPQFYGIVVGTSSFPGDHAIDLQYPAHDAESMMTGLQIGAGKLFGPENVHLRLLTTDSKDESGQPTKTNIVAAFADVTKKARPTDVLLVYLSGHGVNLRSEKDSYYYLTTDARTLDFANNPELRDVSTVSSAELRTWLGAKKMPLKEVLILDTCAAGAANEELLKLVSERGVPPDQRRAVEFLKDATGTIILMGSAADKVSYEASKYGQGLLTYALLEGMKGRSIEDGSRLNVSHWFQNASEDVMQLAQSIGGMQKPVIAAPSGTGFPVALLEPADQARIPLAAIKPELLHLSCHDDHDHDPLGLAVAVREKLREISQPSVRSRGSEPPVVYRDDMNDGPADSLTPKILYSVNGSMAALTLRVDQADNTVKEDHLSLSITDKNTLATTVAARLIEMAGQVPVEGRKP